jgi:toxin ParE1/3/4
MPSYELSIEAAADLESIGDFGVTRFGLAQALKYQLALESRFELLAQFPRMGAPTYDILPGPLPLRGAHDLLYHRFRTDFHCARASCLSRLQATL